MLDNMKTKTIITVIALGAVAVGAFFYFKKSDTPIESSESKDKSEENSECGGCANA